MFPNLVAEMARCGITNREMAKQLELSETAIRNKMTRKTEWNLREISKIKDIITSNPRCSDADMKIDHLFEFVAGEHNECGD